MSRDAFASVVGQRRGLTGRDADERTAELAAERAREARERLYAYLRENPFAELDEYQLGILDTTS